MTLRQTVNPNYGIGATRGWCLQYVDDAISAPNRTYSAQAAYESAKARGWVRANTDMPRCLWSILFWSIDNGEYAGLGHVALVYVNDQGQMAIHDSEVHAGARQPYTSLAELSSWFGSVGTQLTYLGWSIGVDGVQIVGEIGQDEQKQLEEIEKEVTKTKKGELMILFKEANGKVYFLLGNTYTYVGTPKELNKIKVMMNKAGYDTWEHTDPEQIKYLKRLAKNV